MRQRAARQEQTRARIIDAAVALHQELGPASTTVSAVADRAGVQRLTVYRHFPSDRELFAACTAKWLASNPPPDLDELKEDDPLLETRAVLVAIYGYYRRTAGMWAAAFRDVDRVPALAEPMADFAAYLARIRKKLLADFAPAGANKKGAAATLSHALEFPTWQSLSAQGLKDKAMAKLVADWVAASLVSIASQGADAGQVKKRTRAVARAVRAG